MWDAIAFEIRHATRALRRDRGWVAAAVATLAVGIGATTAIFSVINAALFRPLPFRDAGELVVLDRVHVPGNGEPGTDAPNYTDWRHENEVFRAVAAYALGSLNLSAGPTAVRLRAAQITPELFPMLGVRIARGRGFLPQETRPGLDDVALLSDAAWRQYFGGDSGVIGRDVRLNGLAYRVVGILPPGMSFPGRSEVFVPFPIPWDPRHFSFFPKPVVQDVVLARLQRALAVRDAQRLVAAAEARFRIARHVHAEAPLGVTVTPLRENLVGDSGREMALLLGAVILVLLVAYANTAGLLLARAGARRTEFAVREAMGATPGRVVAHLAVEGTLLATAGAVAGVLVALAARSALLPLVPQVLLDLSPVVLDGRVLAFAIGAAAIAVLTFSMVPAVATGTLPLRHALHGARRSGWSVTPSLRGRRALVVVQFAIALVLTIAAGLLVESLHRMHAAANDIDASGVLTAGVSLPRVEYATRASRIGFFDAVLAGLREGRGIRAAGLVSMLPRSGQPYYGVVVRAVGEANAPEQIAPWFLVTTPGYFAAVGLPLLSGRDFTSRDDSSAPRVMIVSETLARRLASGRDVLGLQVGANVFGDTVTRTVVGVVHDASPGAQARDRWGEAYYPYRQVPDRFLESFVLVARGTPGAHGLASAMRKAVQSVDPAVPLYAQRGLADVMSDARAPLSLRTRLLAILAAVALLVSALGIYGVTSFAAAMRTQEFGVRAALGATAGRIERLLLADTANLVIAGTIYGLLGARATMGALSHFLFGVTPYDGGVFVGSVAILGVVAFAASYIPVHRAARLDPVIALRDE